MFFRSSKNSTTSFVWCKKDLNVRRACSHPVNYQKTREKNLKLKKSLLLFAEKLFEPFCPKSIEFFLLANSAQHPLLDERQKSDSTLGRRNRTEREREARNICISDSGQQLRRPGGRKRPLAALLVWKCDGTRPLYTHVLHPCARSPYES